jgi:SAM-dependent methyltransferase
LNAYGFCLDDLKGSTNVNLGCGNRPLKDFINTDYYNTSHADKSFDLEVGLPFGDGSIDLFYSDNVFEHLRGLLETVDRCYAALKTGGYLVVRTPYFKSKHAFVDPTHVRFFTIQSFDYFVRDKYFNQQYNFGEKAFSEINVYLDPGENSFVKNLIAAYGINRPNFFENSILSNFFIFHNIIFVLKK